MDAIKLTGRITESGKLEIELPPGLESGQVRVTIEAIDPDQTWIWTPEWQAGEREADEDIRAGRIDEFETMEDFLDDLMSDVDDE